MWFVSAINGGHGKVAVQFHTMSDKLWVLNFPKQLRTLKSSKYSWRTVRLSLEEFLEFWIFSDFWGSHHFPSRFKIRRGTLLDFSCFFKKKLWTQTDRSSRLLIARQSFLVFWKVEVRPRLFLVKPTGENSKISVFWSQTMALFWNFRTWYSCFTTRARSWGRWWHANFRRTPTFCNRSNLLRTKFGGLSTSMKRCELRLASATPSRIRLLNPDFFRWVNQEMSRLNLWTFPHGVNTSSSGFECSTDGERTHGV